MSLLHHALVWFAGLAVGLGLGTIAEVAKQSIGGKRSGGSLVLGYGILKTKPKIKYHLCFFLFLTNDELLQLYVVVVVELNYIQWPPSLSRS